MKYWWERLQQGLFLYYKVVHVWVRDGRKLAHTYQSRDGERIQATKANKTERASVYQ